MRAEVTVDTHRNALAAAKVFGAWCVEQRWLKDNPASRVKPIGERNRGKPQLRIDETRKLVELCLTLADQGHVGAVAVLTLLLLGLRASEVTDRVCRDLDDEGCLLWVPFGKTRRSKRALEVPELLSPYLVKLAEGRAPDAQLFGAGVVPRQRQEAPAPQAQPLLGARPGQGAVQAGGRARGLRPQPARAPRHAGDRRGGDPAPGRARRSATARSRSRSSTTPTAPRRTAPRRGG